MNTPPLRVLTIAVITAVFTMGNLWIPVLFWDANSDLAEYLAFVLCGVPASQIALLSIWAGLGPGSVIVRLPITIALLVLIACAFVLGLQIPDWLDGQKASMPFEAALFLVIASVFAFISVQAPLWLLRAMTMWRIDLQDRPELTEQEERTQFGLRHLMIWTAIVSVLLVVVKFSMPEADFSSGAPWATLLALMCAFTVFGASVTIPSVFITLGSRGKLIPVLVLIGTTVVGPFAVLFSMAGLFGRGGGDNEEMLLALFCFGFGAAASTLVILGIIRMLDYRMVRPEIGKSLNPSAPLPQGGRSTFGEPDSSPGQVPSEGNDLGPEDSVG